MASGGAFVILGITPDRPETGYGYLLRGADHGGWSELERFVEKPDLETAKSYLASAALRGQTQRQREHER